ncbi:hypothetical protein H0G86_011598 [Trichoderma simmonsii]|uniref:Uncharacterized protein n=1 Tax=Trichoderma simmonsii TaxID=1491479 RepID=A0A8G0LLW2_9HYPO|nr:hypothetical protein H0G86_011598 [Trichoderma simmonsii]
MDASKNSSLPPRGAQLHSDSERQNKPLQSGRVSILVKGHIPVASNSEVLHQLPDLTGLVRSQTNVLSAEVVVHVLGLLGAGNGKDVVALSKQPGQCQLGETAALLRGHLLELVEQLQVLLEIVALELLDAVSVVRLLQLRRVGVLPGQHSAAEGGVCDGGDAQLAAGLEEILGHRAFRLKSPGGVLDLDGGNVVNGACSTETVSGDFREAKVGFLLLEFDHGLDRLLNGRLSVNAVRIVQVDVVNSELLQACLAGRLGVFRSAVDGSLVGAVRLNLCRNAKLGGQEDVGTTLRVQLEPLSDEDLRVAVGI